MIAVVLAAGAGRRLGGNKPLYSWNGTTLIEATIARLKSQCEDIYINSGLVDLERLGYPIVRDDPYLAGLGPLSGVHTALRLASALNQTAIITSPCDMPFLPYDMVTQLTSKDADIVYFGGDRDYPLTSLWRTSLLPSLEAALIAARTDGGLKVMAYIRSRHSVRIDVADPATFRNINRPEDL